MALIVPGRAIRLKHKAWAYTGPSLTPGEVFTWKGSMLLLLSVLNAPSSTQGLGPSGPGRGNFGGAITLLL